jgi:putative membrane protein
MPGARAISEGSDMNDLLRNLVAATVFAALGILIFVLSFLLIDRVTPYNLWKEIVEDRNVALATLLGAVSIGVCIIIAAAVH